MHTIQITIRQLKIEGKIIMDNQMFAMIFSDPRDRFFLLNPSFKAVLNSSLLRWLIQD